jgi:hypothetical protein
VTPDVQLPEPAAQLLSVATSVTEGWLRGGLARVAGSRDLATVAPDDVISGLVANLLEELRDLLATDVDDQRSTPLSLYRNAVATPTSLLRAAGVSPPVLDPFVANSFPDDLYGLGPATWSDIDPAMQEPGLTWGAWKAMTVLQRRRAEGLR